MKIAGIKFNEKKLKRIGNRAVKGSIVGLRKLSGTGQRVGQVAQMVGTAIGQPEIVGAGLAIEGASGKGRALAKDLQRYKKEIKANR